MKHYAVAFFLIVTPLVPAHAGMFAEYFRDDLCEALLDTVPAFGERIPRVGARAAAFYPLLRLELARAVRDDFTKPVVGPEKIDWLREILKDHRGFFFAERPGGPNPWERFLGEVAASRLKESTARLELANESEMPLAHVVSGGARIRKWIDRLGERTRPEVRPDLLHLEEFRRQLDRPELREVAVTALGLRLADAREVDALVVLYFDDLFENDFRLIVHLTDGTRSRK